MGGERGYYNAGNCSRAGNYCNAENDYNVEDHYSTAQGGAAHSTESAACCGEYAKSALRA